MFLKISYVFVLIFIFYKTSYSEQILEIEIKGMMCEMCAENIQKSVKNVDGVKTVNIDFKFKKAVIKADNKLKDKDILKAIQKTGIYKGIILNKTKK